MNKQPPKLIDVIQRVPEDLVIPKDKKVLITIPTLAGHIHLNLMAHVIKWAQTGAQPSVAPGIMPIDHARNESVRTFLRQDYTHLLFIDDDTVPPIDAIIRLLAHDKDIITGITPILRKSEKGMVTAWNAFLRYEESKSGITTMHTVEENTGLQKIVRCGASCLLIKREVFLKVKAPWFIFKWNDDYSGYKSEDVTFCDKAREAGLEIWCDTSVICEHAKMVMI